MNKICIKINKICSKMNKICNNMKNNYIKMYKIRI